MKNHQNPTPTIVFFRHQGTEKLESAGKKNARLLHKQTINLLKEPLNHKCWQQKKLDSYPMCKPLILLNKHPKSSPIFSDISQKKQKKRHFGLWDTPQTIDFAQTLSACVYKKMLIKMQGKAKKVSSPHKKKWRPDRFSCLQSRQEKCPRATIKNESWSAAEVLEFIDKNRNSPPNKFGSINLRYVWSESLTYLKIISKTIYSPLLPILFTSGICCPKTSYFTKQTSMVYTYKHKYKQCQI